MNNLLRLIGRRLIALPIMVFGVTILVFFLMALSPIDQAYSALGESATEAQVQQYREEHGLFQCLEDLMKIKGIKEKTFEKLKDHITI